MESTKIDQEYSTIERQRTALAMGRVVAVTDRGSVDGLRALALASVVALAFVAVPMGPVGSAAAANTQTISSCTTISSSGVHELTGDVDNSSASSDSSCIEITADDVVLDGQGHAITGPGDSESGTVGVNVTANQNVTIRNLTVTKWEHNVEVDGLTGGTITNVSTTDAASSVGFDDDDDLEIAGIALVDSADVYVEDVNATGSGENGIAAIGSTNVTVVDSRLVSNTMRGLYFESVSDSTVRGVNASGATATGVRGHGIHANTSSNLTIEDSVTLSNGDDDDSDGVGVVLEATDGSVVRNVTAKRNGPAGIKVSSLIEPTKVLKESNNNVIENNTVADNDYHGITVIDSSHNTVRNNTVTGHERVGIRVLTVDDTLDNNGFSAPTKVHNVTLANNTVKDNDGGIVISGDERAQYDDLPASVYDVTLRDNTVVDNTDLGVTLTSAHEVTMRENGISGSDRDFVVTEYERTGPSQSLDHYRHDIDASNTVEGRPIHYYRNVSDRTIGTSTNAGVVIVADSSNVTVEDLSLQGNSHGVLVAGSTNATVRNVTATDQTRGIEFLYTDGSNVTGSTVDGTGRRSIALYYSDDNSIAGNSINLAGSGDAGIQAGTGSSGNHIFDNTITYGPSIITSGIDVDEQTDGRADTSDGNLIEDNEIVGGGINVGDVSSTEVRGNVIRDSDPRTAIDNGGSATLILDNRIRNSADGIDTGLGATVRNNTVTGVWDGQGIAASEDAVVRNNVVRNVSEEGIEITGNRVETVDNTVEEAADGVVTQSYVSDVVIANNTITNSTDAGILDEASASDIRGNELRENRQGILLEGTPGSAPVANNSIESSRVGVKVDPNSAGPYDVRDNTVVDSRAWAYHDGNEFGSAAWGGSVENLTLSNARVSFTDREAALVEAAKPAADPANHESLGVYLNATNTSVNAWLNLTVHYGDAIAGCTLDESSIDLYRYDGTDWSMLSTTRDLQADTAQANLTSFGAVGLFANDSVTCTSPASFQVSIDSTNSPITEGDSLTVDATVQNTGEQAGTQTVTLSANGSQHDSTSVTLAGGASKTVTLTWATNTGDDGPHTVTVASDDDAATDSVDVETAGDGGGSTNDGSSDDGSSTGNSAGYGGFTGGSGASDDSSDPDIEDLTDAVPDEAGIQVPIDETPIEELSFEDENLAGAGEVGVETHEEPPSTVADEFGSDRVVSAVDIEVPDAAEDASARITFRLTGAELGGHDPGTLNVVRVTGSEPQRLPTEVSEAPDGSYVVEADTPGFSTFAVVSIQEGTEQAAEETTAVDTATTSQAPATTREPSPEATSRRTETPGGLPGFGPVVAIVALIATALLSRRRMT